MKKTLFTSTIILAGSAQAAGIYLPDIGIDGWVSDAMSPLNLSQSQGFLTLANNNNHVVNPANIIGLKDIAEISIDVTGTVSGGLFTPFMGQSMGIILGRDATDNLDDPEIDLAGGTDALSNIADVYWITQIGAGDLGVRVNLQARSFKEELSLGNANVNEESTLGRAKLYNVTVGLNSSTMPVQATATIGLPTGKSIYTNDTVVPLNINTTTAEIDAGMRIGLAAKYELLRKNGEYASIAGYFGSAKANYGVMDENSNPATVNFNVGTRDENSAYGLVASHERLFGASTRLVSSIAFQYEKNENTTNLDKVADTETITINKVTTIPVAFSIEFQKSEKTQIFASVSSNLYNSDVTAMETRTGTTVTKVDSVRNSWNQTATSATAGISYKMTNNLTTELLINPSFLLFGLDNGVASVARFVYKM